MYPLQGNRDIPGNDPNHQGGDVWVTDAAFDIMDHEDDWSGMLLTYGGIDKAGHMWGGLNDVPPYPATPTRQPHGAHGADRRRAGRPGDRQAQDEACSTRRWSSSPPTTRSTAKLLRRHDGRNRGNFNWYYGPDADETYEQPSRRSRS